MLLNLVRLKYRDTPYFLQISSVTASLSLESSAGIDAAINTGSGGDVISPGVGIAYADSPTISYTPLQGEAFLKSVLSPIPLEAILVMIQSGWSVERVFGLCIERMNDLYNAPRASGPTPNVEPQYKDFKRMLKMFRQFQLDGDLEIGPAFNDELKSNDLIMLFNQAHIDKALLKELGDMLVGKKVSHKTQGGADRVRITTNFIDRKDNQITVRTRSMISLLFYLSQNIDIPAEHSDAGLVTISMNNQGTPFDWSETPAGSVFNIRSSKARPENSVLAIPYRGYWYYIADDDLTSKTTFLLLMQLFNLQAGQKQLTRTYFNYPCDKVNLCSALSFYSFTLNNH